MAKRGPRTPWQERARYLKARCPDRLKPNQIADLLAADAFARWQGFLLNVFLTIRFPDGCASPATFRRGQDRFSKWLRLSGWELRWLYVWEADGPLHVHCLINLPRQIWEAAQSAIGEAFPGCDVDLRGRTPGRRAMAYLIKGTDVVTHARAVGRTGVTARAQGAILWKRCGCTQNLACAARKRAGFPENNCAETSPRNSNNSERKQPGRHAPEPTSSSAILYSLA